MFRIMICLISGVGVLSAPSALDMKDSNMDLKGNILIVKDLEEARSLYPGARITKMEKNDKTKDVITYTLGNHVNGDRLVRKTNDYVEWPKPLSYKLTIVYEPINGSVITFIQIIVDQSSYVGRAYVVSGGIEQRNITFIIEANDTRWFRYEVAIYGLRV